MDWKIKAFKDLTLDELYDLLKLRVDVFVVEQNCPYPEIDDKDRHPETLHLLGKDASRSIQAYLRILPPGLSFEQVSLGRVAVAENMRKKGVSKQMLDLAVKQVKLRWPGKGMKIGAQAYLRQFYESFGFRAVSGIYLEDGIPHIDMVLKNNF